MAVVGLLGLIESNRLFGAGGLLYGWDGLQAFDPHGLELYVRTGD